MFHDTLIELSKAWYDGNLGDREFSARKDWLPGMEIRAYSSYLDSVRAAEREMAAESANDSGKSHLVVHVSDDPGIRQMEDYLNGKVPERGSNVVELIHKFLF